jgi:hypothetical protein
MIDTVPSPARCAPADLSRRAARIASTRPGAARPTAEADRGRRVADPRPPRGSAHHRRQVAATPEALRDRAHPRGATRRAARARRQAPRADPGGADRDPPVPRGRVGSPGRGDIRRLRRPPDGGLRPLGRVRPRSSHARASRRSLIGSRNETKSHSRDMVCSARLPVADPAQTCQEGLL